MANQEQHVRQRTSHLTTDIARYVLKDIERAAAIRGLPIIGPEKGTVLTMVMRERKPKRVLEIGTLVGYSAILMGMSLPVGGTITCIEIDDEFADRARENIRRAGMTAKIRVLTGNALHILMRLRGTHDLLFLDAAKNEYAWYLKEAERLLSPHAVIVADNAGVFREAMADYLREVRSGGAYTSTTYDFGFDAIEVSRRT